MSAEEEQTVGNPWGKTPAWILDPDLYLPAYHAAVPEPQRKAADEKPLNASELRVYIAMRTFADRNGKVKARTQTIADRAKVDKSSAERAIGKFRRLGWLTSKRHYRDDGSISRCDYFMRDTCPTVDDFPLPQDDGGVPVDSRVGYPPNDGEGTRDSTGAKNTPDEHTKRTEGTELSGPTSRRFAPSGGGDETDDDEPLDDDLTDKRSQDRALFRQITGGKLKSDGSKWADGVYTSDAVYTALRKRKPPIVWPGSFLEFLEGRNQAGGIEDWLLSEGLEPA